jgi:hypothetical protein
VNKDAIAGRCNWRAIEINCAVELRMRRQLGVDLGASEEIQCELSLL